jgi:hypothetical protein
VSKVRLTLNILAVVLFTLTVSSLAQAQATRTWVSGVGDDANPCSRTAPCKTFAGAISKTAKDGEIDALDPGGFGNVTITKSITLNGTHGAGYGSILSAGAAQGVLINITDVNDLRKTVRLRSLDINGASTGTDGVKILAANRVYIEDCALDGFTNNCIRDNRNVANAQLFVSDTVTRNAAQSCITIVPTAPGSVIAMLDNVRMEGSSSNSGYAQSGNVQATLHNCVAAGNSQFGVFADGTGGQLNIVSCIVSHNATGISVSSPAIARLTDSTITNNTTASINVIGQIQVQSAGNNIISGNGADNFPTGTALGSH